MSAEGRMMAAAVRHAKTLTGRGTEPGEALVRGLGVAMADVHMAACPSHTSSTCVDLPPWVRRELAKAPAVRSVAARGWVL